MAKNPKAVRGDAKRLASDMRKSGGKPFTADLRAGLNGFKRGDVSKMKYITDYAIRNTGQDSRSRNFHLAASGQVAKDHHEMLDNMDEAYREGKDLKANPPKFPPAN